MKEKIIIYQLPLPFSEEEVERHAQEIVRIFVVDSKPTMTIDPASFEDAQSWGIILADLLHHCSNAYSRLLQQDQTKVMKEILDVMLKELSSPTGDPSGFLIQRGEDEPS